MQQPDHVRFGQEHLARQPRTLVLPADVGVVHLDRDVAAVVRVMRQVDGAGAAASHLVDDHVLADALGYLARIQGLA